MLTAAEIDPTESGFSMDQSTFSRAARAVQYASPFEIAMSLKPLQQSIPDFIGPDRYGARRFFEWFKTVDLESMGARSSPLLKLYYRLPYHIARTWIRYRTGVNGLCSSARRLWQRTGEMG